MGDVPATMDLWDYQAYEGVMMPNATTLTITGLMSTEVTFTETVVNGEVDESLFEMPN